MLKAEDNEILTRVGPGDADGRAAAPLLDPGLPERRRSRSRAARRPGSGCSARTWSRSATPRAGRAGAGELPAPRRVAVLRPQRGRVAPLRLPRLGVRRRRQVRGHAQRAGAVLREGADEGLPGPRVRRHRVDLPGAAGDDDPVPRLRHRRARPGRTWSATKQHRRATGCRRWKATSTPRTSPTCTSGTASTTSPTTALTSPATRRTRCRGSSGGMTARRGSRWTTPGTGTATPASGPRPTATRTCGSPPTRCRTCTMVASIPFSVGCGMFVPIDDENCWRYFSAPSVAATRAATAARTCSRSPRSRRRSAGARAGITARYTADNDYQIDHEVQRNGIFSGVADFVSQDLMVTESMGPIYDRSQEQLGSTDRAITRMRHILLSAAKGLAAGKEPPAVGAGDFRSIRGAEKILEPARTGACSPPRKTPPSPRRSARAHRPPPEGTTLQRRHQACSRRKTTRS